MYQPSSASPLTSQSEAERGALSRCDHRAPGRQQRYPDDFAAGERQLGWLAVLS